MICIPVSCFCFCYVCEFGNKYYYIIIIIIGDIVDSFRIWESHAEPVAMDSVWQDPFDSQPTLCKPPPVTFGSARLQHKVGSVMPAVSEPSPRVTHSSADRELLIQNVLEAMRSRRNIIPERSQEREL